MKLKNNIVVFFLKTKNNSWIPVSRTKIKKNIKKYPPLKIRKIDIGRIISDVKILFCKLFIFYQSFF